MENNEANTVFKPLADDAFRRYRGNAVDELGFADRFHRRCAIGAVHRAALEIDGGADIVAGLHVAEQFV